MASATGSFTKYLQGQNGLMFNAHVIVPNLSKIIDKPKFLPEAAAEVLRQLVAVLKTCQQEATALE